MGAGSFRQGLANSGARLGGVGVMPTPLHTPTLKERITDKLQDSVSLLCCSGLRYSRQCCDRGVSQYLQVDSLHNWTRRALKATDLVNRYNLLPLLLITQHRLSMVGLGLIMCYCVIVLHFVYLSLVSIQLVFAYCVFVKLRVLRGYKQTRRNSTTGTRRLTQGSVGQVEKAGSVVKEYQGVQKSSAKLQN